MTSAAPTRVGWCPGALRPMEAGDGYILRVKPHGGRLDLGTAERLGELALRFGTGDIDLTSRANLQIRGVAEGAVQALTDGLSTLGLLDANPDAEAVRNIVASPLAGYEGTAVLDVRPIVRALEHRLAQPDLWGLPAKWSIVVDDGGSMSLSDVAADLRFEVSGGSILVGLAQDPGRAPCAPEAVAEVAGAFAALAIRSGRQRLGDLVEAEGAPALFAAAGLRSLAQNPRRRPAMVARDVVGFHVAGHLSFVGAGVPFGALRAEALMRLAQTVRRAGADELRLTPWRVLLAPGVGTSDQTLVTAMLAETKLILNPGDTRLAIAACSGTPACQRATTPVRAHAAALAASMAPARGSGRIAVHVSGCSKGCAHASAAPWTLVGREGRYDLVRNGNAADAPVARAMTFQEAAVWLSRFPDQGRH